MVIVVVKRILKCVSIYYKAILIVVVYFMARPVIESVVYSI